VTVGYRRYLGALTQFGGSKQADNKISVIGCGEQWYKSK